MQQRRINVCKNLSVDHPLQPPMFDPIQFVPADAEGVDDHIGTYIAIIDVSSSQPISQTQTPTQTSEPSIIQNLVNHYSGELPGYESNLEKASDIASDEVMTESPHQQTPNQEMASSTNTNYVLIPNPVPEQNVPELVVPEQPASELIVLEQGINNQSPTTNTFVEPQTSINDQPSSSNIAIQLCAPAKTNVPSPPTLFLDSTIIADVCENIFQELNSLVQARNNLIHEDIYEKQWKRLKERVDYVLTKLQRPCLDNQDSTQNKLREWLKGVDSNLQEVKVLRTWVRTPLSLRARNATDFIPTGIHLRELNINWLSKININPVSTDLTLLQRNAELEKENKQLRNTRPLQKQNWKKPELEKRISSEAMMNSRKR